jgi:hypothetical protein
MLRDKIFVFMPVRQFDSARIRRSPTQMRGESLTSPAFAALIGGCAPAETEQAGRNVFTLGQTHRDFVPLEIDGSRA